MTTYSQILATIQTLLTGVPKNITPAKLRSILTDLADYANAIRGDFQGAAAPADNPGVPAGPVYYFATTSGTYTNFGGLIVDVTEGLTILVYDGSTWEKSVVPIELGGYVKTDSFNSLEDSLFSRINIFNKEDVIVGFFISSTSGSLLGNEPSIVSNWIKIDPLKKYHVSGRTTSGLRFRNASGTLLQPLNSSGTPVTNWSSPSGNNGIIYPPSGAVELQMTITLSGDGDINTVQLEEGEVGSPYSPYTDVFLNPSLVTDYVKSSTLENSLSKKVDGDYLFDFVNLFDKNNVVEGFYVNSNHGGLSNDATSAVSSVIPVTGGEIYFLQGKTTNQREIVFFDSSGIRLKPLSISGVEFPNFATSINNTAVMAPPTAISVQFTIKFLGTGVYDNIMFSQSEIEVLYKNFGVFNIKENLIPKIFIDKSFKVVKDSSEVRIRTSFDNLHDIHIRLSTAGYINGLFNINQAKLLLKNEPDSSAGIVINGTGGDDSAPSFFNNVIVGGNHGSPAYLITANSHGKTIADVGAVYSDSNNRRFIVIKIDDANNFSVGIENISTTETWTFFAPVAPLTYVSNGNSTTSVNFTASASFQLYPSIKNVVQRLIIDNVEEVELATYQGEKINIVETYDIIDYPDMLAKLTANRPSEGYLSQPSFTNADAIISVTNIFNIQSKGTITIVNSWSVEKTLNLNRYFGITQNGYITPSWATTCRRYFPKTLPITNNGNTFDFRLKPEFKTPVISGVINITPEFWEDGKPVNRVVDILEGTTLNLNFNLGYLPLGGNRVNMVNNAWEMTSTKKLYPRYIDGKIGVSNVVSEGTVKQGVAFRGWSKPNGLRTNEFLVENGGKYYLYLDYHQVGTDTIDLPSYLLGKSISVIDKSANVELLSSLISGSLKVKISSSSPIYGYCELLIE